MKTKTIRVLRRHIKAGKLGESERCPIALAAKNAGFKGGRVSDVYDGDHWYLDKDKKIIIPTKAKNFAERFDRGKPVKPFSFKVRVPGEGT